MSEHLFLGDTTYPHTPSEATIKVEIDSKRADALAAVIKDLCRLVTTDFETKQDFIDSVKKVLGDDPDLRVSRLHDRIEQLELELEEAQKDASRYAWAASNPLYFMHLCHGSQAINNTIDECIAEDKE